jgi:hypothetical protein
MEIDRKDEDFLKALILYILDSLGDDEDLRLSTRLVKEESNANLEVVNSD